jgi:hypothetical protein
VSAPEIVVLCGSTRFYDQFQEHNYRLTMEGRIVLSVGFYPHATAEHGHGEGVGHDSAEKVALDTLHLRKIDLAGRVFVINPGGYIGNSTHREIAYAVNTGKPVDYLVPPSVHVGQVATAAILAAGGRSSAVISCRMLADVVRLHVDSTATALVVEPPLIEAGYRVEVEADGVHGVRLLLERSTCMACPPACGTCSGQHTDCECYEHQEAGVVDVAELNRHFRWNQPGPAVKRYAEPEDAD